MHVLDVPWYLGKDPGQRLLGVDSNDMPSSSAWPISAHQLSHLHSTTPGPLISPSNLLSPRLAMEYDNSASPMTSTSRPTSSEGPDPCDNAGADAVTAQGRPRWFPVLTLQTWPVPGRHAA